MSDDEFITVSIKIKRDVWEDFRNFVFSKYGSLYGCLKLEVSYALEYYLKHATTNTQQEFEQIISKPNKKHLKLLYWLAEEFPIQITHSDLETFVIENFGSDKRTKKKYIHDFLVRLKFIEVQKSLYGRNIIYRVNLERIIDFLRKYAPKEKIEELESILRRVKEEEEKKPAVKGIPVSGDNGSKPVSEAASYAVERYRAGDSIEDIADSLQSFGLEFSKQSVRSLIRKALKEERG